MSSRVNPSSHAHHEQHHDQGPQQVAYCACGRKGSVRKRVNINTVGCEGESVLPGCSISKRERPCMALAVVRLDVLGTAVLCQRYAMCEVDCAEVHTADHPLWY